MDTLKNNFEVIYKEWFEYNEFFKTLEHDPEKRRQQLAQKVNEGLAEEELVDLVFENGMGYQIHKVDLDILSQRLISAYKTVEDYLEIPKEAVDNIKQLIQSPTLYTIKNGSPIAIDPEFLEQTKNTIRKEYDEVYKLLKEESTSKG